MKILRLTFLVSLIVFSPFSILAQFAWFHDFVGNSYTGAESLSIDPQDNLSVIGNFENGVTLMGSTYTGKGSFVLKLTKNGVPLWHKIIRYAPSDFWSLSNVGTDADGNTYITGMFPSSATIDGVPITGSVYNSLLAKFNASGELQWTKVIQNLQEIFDMDVNLAGDILLYSRHFGTVIIDNVNLPVQNNSFCVVFSSDGDFRWAKTIGNIQQYTTWPKACDLDETGNAYVHGIYTGTLALDGKQVVNADGNYDFFFAKISPQGRCEWLSAAVRKAPAIYEPTTNPPNGLILERGAIESDSEGNLYASGTFWQGMKAGTTLLSPTYSGIDANHLFLLKFNAAGDVEWAKSPASNSSNNTVDDIVVKNERVYFAGIRSGQYYFSVYSPAGEPLWNPVMISLDGDIASGLGVDSNNFLYMSGRTSNLPSAYFKGFVFKYNFKANQPPGNAGAITSPSTVCIHDQSILIESAVIERATSYEWEVIVNGQSFYFTSPESRIELSISDLSIAGDFYVRVRGINDFGASSFTTLHKVKVETSLLTAPILRATCKEVYLEETELKIQWYRDNEWLTKYPETQTRIRPEENGLYHVTVSNACGLVTSNVIDFMPVSTASLFIPNIITPNGDIPNEYFVIDPKIESPMLAIENRWGKLIFSSPAYSNDWNGGEVPSGVYFYTINSPCLVQPIKGTLTIRR